MMDPIMMTGLIAGALTTLSFLPQVIRSWKLKETRDLSMAMLISFAAGVCIWIIYGIWVNSFPVILANIVTFALVIILVFLKLKYH
jgi:MtN3 and saliva related transmembrane protein